MTIIVANGSKVPKYPISHDPNETKYYTFVYRPPQWASSTLYALDSIVVPQTATGYYHICTNPGISGSVAPSFSTTINGSTIDGTVTWRAVPYNLCLQANDTIIASTWECAGGTVDNTDFTGNITSCRVSGVSTTLSSIILTNHVTINRFDSKIEILDRSILVPVMQL